MLVGFDSALSFIQSVAIDGAHVLIAIDQPLIVNNPTGKRPCERVAGSILGRMKSAAQPANTEGSGARFFGSGAGIRRFLDALQPDLAPRRARATGPGLCAIEVFPALALATLVPETWDRRTAAKYNPANRATFNIDDWILVCDTVTTWARSEGFKQISKLTDQWSRLERPKKSDQDKLDAILCLVVAYKWWFGEPDECVVIGSMDAGYIVTPCSNEVRTVLHQVAESKDVPLNGNFDLRSPGPIERSRQLVIPVDPPTRRVRVVESKQADGRSRIDPATLHRQLIECARQRRTVTYGEVAALNGHRWSQGLGTSLAGALESISKTNSHRREPQLMCLVVNKRTGLPGHGFYLTMGDGQDGRESTELFERERDRCFLWDWSGAESCSWGEGVSK